MQFGNIVLNTEEVDDLYLLIGHCAGKLPNKLINAMEDFIALDKEPNWDKVKPKVEIEESHIVQFELHFED